MGPVSSLELLVDAAVGESELQTFSRKVLFYPFLCYKLNDKKDVSCLLCSVLLSYNLVFVFSYTWTVKSSQLSYCFSIC